MSDIKFECEFCGGLSEDLSQDSRLPEQFRHGVYDVQEVLEVRIVHIEAVDPDKNCSLIAQIFGCTSCKKRMVHEIARCSPSGRVPSFDRPYCCRSELRQ